MTSKEWGLYWLSYIPSDREGNWNTAGLSLSSPRFLSNRWGPPQEKRTNTRWGEVSPSGLLRALMGITHKPNYNYQTDFLDEIRRMKSNKGIYQVELRDLPDLVTFADPADPNSVMVVDAGHLDATLGPGVAWQSITIQIVDEPVTRGLSEKLPWLKSMKNDAVLDGGCCEVYAKTNLSNKLQRHSFVFPY